MKSIKLDYQTYIHVFVKNIPLDLDEVILLSEESLNETTKDFENKYIKQANDYIDALEGHECVAFLEAPHKVSAQRIVEHWNKYSPQRLKEKQYKKYLNYK